MADNNNNQPRPPRRRRRRGQPRLNYAQDRAFERQRGRARRDNRTPEEVARNNERRRQRRARLQANVNRALEVAVVGGGRVNVQIARQAIQAAVGVHQQRLARRRERWHERILADPDFRAHEQARWREARRRRHGINSVEQYEAAIAQGHTEVCSCCERLHLPDSIVRRTVRQLRDRGLPEPLIRLACPGLAVAGEGRLPDDLLLTLCTGCRTEVVTRRRLPVLCAATYRWPVVPEIVRQLNRTEELLLAPELPFLQLMPLTWPDAAGGADERHNRHRRVIYILLDTEAAANAAALGGGGGGGWAVGQQRLLPRDMTATAVIQFNVRTIGGGRLRDFSIARPVVVYETARQVLGRPLFAGYAINLHYQPHLLQRNELYLVHAEERARLRAILEGGGGGGDHQGNNNNNNNAPPPPAVVVVPQPDVEMADNDNDNDEADYDSDQDRDQAEGGGSSDEWTDEEGGGSGDEGEGELQQYEPDNPVAGETLILNHSDVIMRPNAQEWHAGAPPGHAARLFELLANRLEANPNLEYACFLKAYGGDVPQFTDPDVLLARVLGDEPAAGRQRRGVYTYSKLSRYQLRHCERRVVRGDHIFFKLCKLLVETLRSDANIALRQTRPDGRPAITAEQARNRAFMEQVVNDNRGYHMLQHSRGSPAYWKERKRDLMAMIRQLGKPTFFMTLSQAQTRWPELMMVLSKALDGVVLTREQAEALPYGAKTDLLRRDPVTVVLYFERRVRSLFRLMASEEGGSPFGRGHQVVDYHYRVEFGNESGAPHIHCLLWLADGQYASAPPLPRAVNLRNFSAVDGRRLAAFVDAHISCSGGQNRADQELVAAFQVHRHSATCQVVVGRIGGEPTGGNAAAAAVGCRFGFPAPPMPETMLLTPLTRAERTPQIVNRWTRIAAWLEAATPQELDTLPTFDHVLQALGGLTQNQYLAAVRYSLTRPRVMLHRRAAEIWINPYCPALLRLHRANMDMQYVLDPYAAAAYINKCGGAGSKAFSQGTSSFLTQLAEETRRTSRHTLRQRLAAIAGRFFNSVEVHLSEALYHVLGLSFSVASRQAVFINTHHPDRRTRLLLPRRELEVLQRGSTDIYMPNRIIYYSSRHAALEGLCLAEVIAHYDVVTVAVAQAGAVAAAEVVVEEEEEVEEDQEDPIEGVGGGDEEGDEQGGEAPDPDQGNRRLFRIAGFGNRKCHKRLGGFGRIIRYCRFSERTDPADYYREQLMLYLPWRDEAAFADLFEEELRALYTANRELIEANRARFNQAEVEQLVREVEAAIVEEEADDLALVAAAGDDQVDAEEDQADAAEGLLQPADDGGPPPERGPARQPRLERRRDFAVAYPRQQVVNLPEDVWTPPRSEDVERRMASLNQEQRLVVLETLALLERGAPFYLFISGGAGTGKSYLIKTLEMAVNYRLNAAVIEAAAEAERYGDVEPPAEQPANRVLLVAPTARAADIIGGQTMHAAFKLPFSHDQDQYAGQALPRLSAGQLNTLRTSLLPIHLVIVDEASMAGGGLAGQTHIRFSEVSGLRRTDIPLPFGGRKSFIFVGDFCQLQPVSDTWIFGAGAGGNIRGGALVVLTGNWLWSHFRFYELTILMRQADGGAFATALNELRVGRVSRTSAALLANCHEASWRGNDPRWQYLAAPDTLHLFRDNASVDAYNAAALATMALYAPAGGTAESTALDGFDVAGLDGEADEVGKLARLHHTKTGNMPTRLPLVVGAPYMVTVNVRTRDGLVNGLIGVLERIDSRAFERVAGAGAAAAAAGGTRPYLLWFSFGGGIAAAPGGDGGNGGQLRIGRRERAAYQRHIEQLNAAEMGGGGNLAIPPNWTPLELRTRTVRRVLFGGVRRSIKRQQFPLVPALAVTLHKAQGGTYTRVAFHLPDVGEGGFPLTLSQLYVACSRVTTREGLFLLGGGLQWQPLLAQLTLPPEVAAEYERLQERRNRLRHRLPQWQTEAAVAADRRQQHHFKLLYAHLAAPPGALFEGVELTAQLAALTADTAYRQAELVMLSGMSLVTVQAADWGGDHSPLRGRAAAHRNLALVKASAAGRVRTVRHLVHNTEGGGGGKLRMYILQLGTLTAAAAAHWHHEEGVVKDAEVLPYDNASDTTSEESDNEDARGRPWPLPATRRPPVYVAVIYRTSAYPMEDLLFHLEQLISQQMRTPPARLLVLGNMGTDLRTTGVDEQGDADRLYNFLTDTLGLDNLLSSPWSVGMADVGGRAADEEAAELSSTGSLLPFTTHDGRHLSLAFGSAVEAEVGGDGPLGMLANTYMSVTCPHKPLFIYV